MELGEEKMQLLRVIRRAGPTGVLVTDQNRKAIERLVRERKVDIGYLGGALMVAVAIPILAPSGDEASVV